MEFEWDPAKNVECLARRSIDFADAAKIFEGWVFERLDTRRDYQERRVVFIGLVGGLGMTVVYSARQRPDGAIVRRIISARRSNRHERKAYQASFESR